MRKDKHKKKSTTKTKSIMTESTGRHSCSSSGSESGSESTCIEKCISRYNLLRNYYVMCIAIHSIQLYLLYFFWIILHSFSANAYVYFCAHPSVYGVIHSFLFSQSPHCKMLFFLTDVGSQMINAVWISVGLWLMNTITRKYPKITVRNDYLPSKSSIQSVVK